MENEEFKPQDFIYCGKRQVKGGLGDSIRLLNADGSLADEKIYKAPRGSQLHIIGGIFTGATFTESQARGVFIAKWTGKRFADREQIALWEAEGAAAERDKALEKRMASEAEKSELDDMTIRQLRVLISKTANRGDWAGAEALRTVAYSRIQKRATKAELE